MTQNEINIIEREVAARLPYGLMVKYDLGNSYLYPKIGCVYLWHHNGFCSIYMVDKYPENWFLPIKTEIAHWNEIKPYLRPMSSMTENEKIDFYTNIFDCDDDDLAGKREDNNGVLPLPYSPMGHDSYFPDGAYMSDLVYAVQWFYKHHFDVYGLIGKGLALVAPDGMYDFSDTDESCNK